MHYPWYNNNPLPLTYFGQCDYLRRAGYEYHWQQMMSHRVPITMEQFESEVDLSVLLEENESLLDFIAGDSTSQFFESVWGHRKCMFIQTHGFEFVFI